MNRWRLFLLTCVGALAVTYVTHVAMPAAVRADQYGPPVAPAMIVTTPDDYGSEPVAEQGEGGPDEPPPPWAVPAGSCRDVRALLNRHDVTGDTADRLVWIAREESDCGILRVNDDSQDYGIWQVNWPTWGAPLCQRASLCTTPWMLAHDDDTQIEAVRWILGWQGWGAWCWATDNHVARGVGYTCPFS